MSVRQHQASSYKIHDKVNNSKVINLKQIQRNYIKKALAENKSIDTTNKNNNEQNGSYFNEKSQKLSR